MINKLYKKQGWEVRLNDLVMAYYFLPFERGQNCCFLFMSDAIEAIAGESPLSEWRGKFKTKQKAFALLLKHAGSTSFEKCFQWLEPVPSHAFAQRGDVGIWVDENGIETVGVVSMNARDFLYRAEDRDGLIAEKICDKMRLWRVV